MVVGTFGTLYGVEGHGLINALQGTFTPLSAISFLVFTLLYIPCIATIAVIKRETNSWRWTVFAIVFTITIAWIFSFIIYQGGLILGFI